MTAAGSDGAGSGGAGSDAALVAVHAHVVAVNARDVDAVMGGFDDDAVFTSPDGTVIGSRGIRALFADAFAAPVTATLELRRAVTSGDTVACELVERIDLGEQLHEIEVAGFYTIRNGGIARVRLYRDG